MLPIMELSEKPTLIISDTVISQIKILCDRWSHLEWSGILFLDVEGDIKDISKMKFTAIYIHLMDVGSSAYTEYLADESIIDLFDAHPELMKKKQAQVHSHNNMGSFFSGTDDDELRTNSMNYNYYVSLIVNNKLDFCAKVAFPTLVEGKTFYKDKSGALCSVSDVHEEAISIATLSVKQEASAFFVDRMETVENIKKKKEAEEAAKRPVNIYQESWEQYRYAGGRLSNPSLFNPFPHSDTTKDTLGESLGKRTTKIDMISDTRNFVDCTQILCKLFLQDKTIITPLSEAIEKAQDKFIHQDALLDKKDEEWLWNNFDTVVKHVCGDITVLDSALLVDLLIGRCQTMNRAIATWMIKILKDIKGTLDEWCKDTTKVDSTLFLSNSHKKSNAGLLP